MTSSIVVRGISFVLLVGLLAGCGSDGSSPGVAKADRPPDSGTAMPLDSNGDTSQLTDEEIITRFSECMRDHGVFTADPELNADGTVNWEALKEGIVQDPNYDPKSSISARAYDDCVPLLSGAIFTKETSAEDEIELQDDLLAFAQCLRDEGLDASDPDFSEGSRLSKDSIFENIKGANSRVQSTIDLCSERIFGGGRSSK